MLHYSYIEDSVEFSMMLDRKEVYIIGSFTDWKKVEEFRLEKKGQFYYLKKKVEEVSKLGNSGYPEYYLWDDSEKEIIDFDKNYPKGHYFNNQANSGYNYLLLPKSTSTPTLIEIDEASKKSFKIKGFLEEFDTAQELGNFRQLDGGLLSSKRIFRSYHPLISSRSDSYKLRDIERIRQRSVRELINFHRIKTVINLSESKKELDNIMADSRMCYYKRIWALGSVYNVPMSYETVYFMSDRDEEFNEEEYGFQSGIKKIIEIISKTEGPYLIHCRLGSDRTGVVSAFIQLLMGASKEEVERNYLLTNNLGIGEYRSFRLLESSLYRALGLDCFENSSEKTVKYLVDLGLDIKVIERARHNLAETNYDFQMINIEEKAQVMDLQK